MGLFGRKIKDPVQGWAVVVDPWKQIDQAGAAGNCKMKLDLVEVPGVERQLVPYHLKLTTTNRWPEEGDRVAVTVDRSNPEKVDPDWDSLFGEMPGGALGYAVEGFASAAGVDVSLSGIKDRETSGPVDDYQAVIADLNARHARGEITYEEMAAGVQQALTGGS